MIPQVHFIVSRGAIIAKKIEKENQIIGTNTLFKYTYTSNFCATFR